MKNNINLRVLMAIGIFTISMLGYSDETPVPEDMVLIPAGEFQMGSDHTEAGEDEQPVHTVYVDAFYMDTHEVTNAEYKEFLLENPQWKKAEIQEKFHDDRYLRNWSGNKYPSGKADHPVNYISWYAAMAYAKWAGKRLPTEAEWEKAARGGLLGRKYPWGDTITPENANYGRNIGKVSPVGQYAPNGYGLYDMAGNVWEWCLDAYNPDYYTMSPGRNPFSDRNNVEWTINNFTNVEKERSIRGGDWYTEPQYTRCTFRFSQIPSHTSSNIGFRCVKPATP